MKVALLPTGQAELHGLDHALAGLFPEHRFECMAADLRPLPESKMRTVHHGFTSVAVNPEWAAQPRSNLRRLVASMAALVSGSSRAGAYDLVVALEDLELANQEAPGNVVDAVRKAVRAHLAQPRVVDRVGAELPNRLRDRASFHLAAPMLEGWFFGDTDCLGEAPEPPRRLHAKLQRGRDPESFVTDDAAYLADRGGECPQPPDWAKGTIDQRKGHPKRYLQWLCRDLADAKCTTYRETKGGVRCLKALPWDRVLARGHHYRYLRALVADLCDGLGESLPFADEEVAELTCRKHALSGHVLRNL